MLEVRCDKSKWANKIYYSNGSPQNKKKTPIDLLLYLIFLSDVLNINTKMISLQRKTTAKLCSGIKILEFLTGVYLSYVPHEVWSLYQEKTLGLAPASRPGIEERL